MGMIAKTAIIENGAIIGENVEIADYCFVSKNSKIGNGTKLYQGACIYGDTEIGENNEIFSYSVLGSKPQDLKFKDEKVKLIIGDNNKIREFTFFNPGTKGGGSITKIGNNNLFMGYVHIAHDCIIGNNSIFANAVTVAGHVEIEDYVIIGGMTPIHQFIKIGEYAMVAGASALAQDVPPYCMAEGNRAMLRGLNLTGLRRHFNDRKEINLISNVYKELFEKGKPLQEVATKIFDETDNKKIKKMCEFILNTKRGIPFKRKDNG